MLGTKGSLVVDPVLYDVDKDFAFLRIISGKCREVNSGCVWNIETWSPNCTDRVGWLLVVSQLH
jgi:hypothetical protein